MRMIKSARMTMVLMVVVAIGWGMMVGPGCGSDGAGSAPKLKGSKDDIQKASQPPLPDKRKR